MDQINEFIEQMGDSFDAQMTIYFDDFKNSMKKRMRIPVSLVDQHEMTFVFLWILTSSTFKQSSLELDGLDHWDMSLMWTKL